MPTKNPDLFKKMADRLGRVKDFVDEINKTEGRNLEAEQIMIPGPSKMYKNHASAADAMKNPQLAKIKEKLDAKIKDILRGR